MALKQDRDRLEKLEKEHANFVKEAGDLETKRKVRAGDLKKAEKVVTDLGKEIAKLGADKKAKDRSATSHAAKITRLKADIARQEKREKP